MISRGGCKAVTLGVATVVFAVACTGTSYAGRQAAADCSSPSAQPAKASAPLPTMFPTPRGITYGSVKTAGSATVVHVYSSSSRQITFDLYKRDLASNPYQVSRSLFNGRDAEIYFLGDGVNGHVAVLTGCSGVVPVDITLQQAAVTGQ